MPVRDATQRFSSRVSNYVRYRPGYPSAVLELLKHDCRLTPSAVIADVASGTGIFTRLLLENGNRVFAVEPNPEMRQAAEELLAGFPKFTSVSGSAEATTLAEHGVDFVTAAQAAHWFDREKARREFVRILKPGGWAVLLWNERLTDTTPFLRDYEKLLLTFATDYQEVRHERTTGEIDLFFAPFARFKRECLRTARSWIFRRSKGGCSLLLMLRCRKIRDTGPCWQNCGESTTLTRPTAG